MSEPVQTNQDQEKPVVVEGPSGGFAQQITIGGFHLVADEPAAAGGTDTGPGPYDLLRAALGACTSMTVSLYARRKQWPLESVSVVLRHAKVPNPDGGGGLRDRFERDITLRGTLSEEQRARLLEIANKCPVHRTLTSQVDIATRLV